MKNLLVYISPNHKFNLEHEIMAEVQIDNSLEYWDKKDIVLLTNFPYEYNGIKAIVGRDNLINEAYYRHPRGIVNSKVNAIIYLLENGLKESTWFHDLDAFQIASIAVNLKKDMGCAQYGKYPKKCLINLGKDYNPRINSSSVFFQPESLDIFRLLLDKMQEDHLYEEDAMTLLYHEDKWLRKRMEVMNQTYNIGIRCTKDNIQAAEKPLKIAHFPPQEARWLQKFRPILPSNLLTKIDEKFHDFCPSGQAV